MAVVQDHVHSVGFGRKDKGPAEVFHADWAFAIEQGRKQRSAAAAKAFPKGVRVKCTDENDQTPKGAIGTVQEPDSNTKPGFIKVKFPKGVWHFPASKLRKPA